MFFFFFFFCFFFVCFFFFFFFFGVGISFCLRHFLIIAYFYLYEMYILAKCSQNVPRYQKTKKKNVRTKKHLVNPTGFICFYVLQRHVLCIGYLLIFLSME